MVQKPLNQLLMKLALFAAAIFFVVAFSIRSSFGVPPSAPTAGIAVTPLSVPTEMGELAGYSGGVRYGYYAFINTNTAAPTDIYLNVTYESYNPYTMENYKTDKLTGAHTINLFGITNFDYSAFYYADAQPWSRGVFAVSTSREGFVSQVTNSETSMSQYYLEYGTNPYNITLDTLYPAQEFKTNVESRVPAFSNNFTIDTGTEQGAIDQGSGYAYRYLSQPDQIYYSLQKLQYKWNVNPVSNQVVVWDEQFQQDGYTDGSGNWVAPPVLHKIQSWTNTTGTNYSTNFVIDPAHYTNADGTLQTNNGYWAVMTPLKFFLDQANYPTNTNATDRDLGGYAYTNLPDQGTNTTAYITGEPAMPDLWTLIYADGFTTNMSISWWMTVTSDRPKFRGTQDDFRIPASGTLETPMNLYWNLGTNFGTNFFGGVATIHFTIQGQDGTTLVPEQIYTFKIRGKNPMPQAAHDYINSEPGGTSTFYYAWAIAKHESATHGDGQYLPYNQFAPQNGGAHGDSGQPYFASSEKNGWGIFQRDPTHGGIPATTAQLYNWKINCDVAVQQELVQKYTPAANYLASIGVSPPPYTTNGTNFSAVDTLTMELYNGAKGRPLSKMLIYTAKYPPGVGLGKQWQWNLPDAPEKEVKEPYAAKIARVIKSPP